MDSAETRRVVDADDVVGTRDVAEFAGVSHTNSARTPGATGAGVRGRGRGCESHRWSVTSSMSCTRSKRSPAHTTRPASQSSRDGNSSDKPDKRSVARFKLTHYPAAGPDPRRCRSQPGRFSGCGDASRRLGLGLRPVLPRHDRPRRRPGARLAGPGVRTGRMGSPRQRGRVAAS